MFDALPTGLMANPSIGYDYHEGRLWAADNGCFNARWDAGKWLTYLRRWSHDTTRCLFAVVPDVVGNHVETLALWRQWEPTVRQLGYQTAFVVQNGCTATDVPWDCDAVFIGGDDAYKLSPTVHAIAAEARRRGKWVHMGRVNSLRRLRIAHDMGCDSVDGTFLAFGPDINTPRLASWFHSLSAQPSLFQPEGITL